MNINWYRQHYPEEYKAAVEEFNQWAELHGIEPYYDYDLAPKPSGELIHFDSYDPTIAHASSITPIRSDVPCVTESNIEEISKEYEVIPVYVVSAREPITWIVGRRKSMLASECLILK